MLLRVFLFLVRRGEAAPYQEEKIFGVLRPLQPLPGAK